MIELSSITPTRVSQLTDPRPTILIVDSDQVNLGEWIDRFSGERYRVFLTGCGAEAISLLADLDPDLVLMEWSLPDMTGARLCRHIRIRGSIPVLVMSAMYAESEMVTCLESGADGYLTKPIRWRELMARIAAALRRSRLGGFSINEPIYEVRGITLDAERHEVWVGSRQLVLPLREFQLLEVLIASPGKVWTRAALMRRVWGETPDSGTKTLGVHIARLRSRIEDDPAAPNRILTVRGVGYTFAPGARSGDHSDVAFVRSPDEEPGVGRRMGRDGAC